MGEQMLESKSETIGVAEQRKLREFTHQLGSVLTESEYITIAKVFGSAIDRLCKENDVEL